eukprot:12928986-Prorocentrum_lima.AAC.1
MRGCISQGAQDGFSTPIKLFHSFCKQAQWAHAVATLHQLTGFGVETGTIPFNALINACGK